MKTLILKNHKPPCLKVKAIASTFYKPKDKKDNYLFLLSQDDYLYVYTARRNHLDPKNFQDSQKKNHGENEEKETKSELKKDQNIKEDDSQNKFYPSNKWSDDLILSSVFYLTQSTNDILFHDNSLYVSTENGLFTLQNDFTLSPLILNKNLQKILYLNNKFFLIEKHDRNRKLILLSDGERVICSSNKKIFIQYSFKEKKYYILSNELQTVDESYEDTGKKWQWLHEDITGFHIFESIDFDCYPESNKDSLKMDAKHNYEKIDVKSDELENAEENNSNSRPKNHSDMDQAKNITTLGAVLTVSGNLYIFRLNNGAILSKSKISEDKIEHSILTKIKDKSYLICSCTDGKIYKIDLSDLTHSKLHYHNDIVFLYKMNNKHILSFSDLFFDIFLNEKSDMYFKYSGGVKCVEQNEDFFVVREEKSLNFYVIQGKEKNEKEGTNEQKEIDAVHSDSKNNHSIEYLLKYNSSDKIMYFNITKNHLIYQLKNKTVIYSLHFESKMNLIKIKDIESKGIFLMKDRIHVIGTKNRTFVIDENKELKEENTQDLSTVNIFELLRENDKFRNDESLYTFINNRYETLIFRNHTQIKKIPHKKIFKGLKIKNEYIFITIDSIFKLKERNDEFELKSIVLGKFLIDICWMKEYLVVLQEEIDESNKNEWGNRRSEK